MKNPFRITFLKLFLCQLSTSVSFPRLNPTMKVSTFSVITAASVVNAAPQLLSRAEGVTGFDISNYQSDVDFQGAYDSGARFVMIKVQQPPYLSHNYNTKREYKTNPTPLTDHRRHRLHRPQLLNALRGRHRSRHLPRRIPLRTSRLRLRKRTSTVLHRERRRLVRRRRDTPGNARYRIRSGPRDQRLLRC